MTTNREKLVSRGAMMETMWQGMVRYGEYCEGYIQQHGMQGFRQAIDEGNIAPIFFVRCRVMFETLWYGRTPLLRD